VLRTSRNRAGTLLADFLLDVFPGTASMNVLRLRRQGNLSIHVFAGGDELALTPIPFGENLGRRRAAKDTRVDDTSESNAGNMSRGAEDAFEVPDRFGAMEM